MEQFQNLTVNGISFMLLVVGLVQAVKKLGVSGPVLALIAMILGAALAIGSKVAAFDPQFKIWFEIITYGLGGGLAATGYYDLLNERLPKIARITAVSYPVNKTD